MSEAKTGQINPSTSTVIGALDTSGAVRPASATNPIPVTVGAIPAAGVLVGQLTHTTTTGAATLLTVPAGKTWEGTVAVSATGSKAAAATGNGEVAGVIATAGTGVVPTAGTVFAVRAYIGAGAVGGLAGAQGSQFGSVPLTVVAPAGNTVTLTLASTLGNVTDGSVDATASGEYVN